MTHARVIIFGFTILNLHAREHHSELALANLTDYKTERLMSLNLLYNYPKMEAKNSHLILLQPRALLVL